MANELRALGLVGEIKANHREALKAGNAFVNHALQAGELLIRAKADCPHGEWESYVEKCSTAGCPLTSRTAQRYMKASRDLGALPKATRMSFLKTSTSFEDLRGLLSPKPKHPTTTIDGPPQNDRIVTAPVTDDEPIQPNHQRDIVESTEESTDVPCSRCSGSGRIPITAKMPVALSQSTDFVNTWQDYQLSRIQKPSKLTTVGISRLFRKLESWGPEKATKALEITMENGWTGVFEPNQGGRASDDPRGNMATLEAYIDQL